MKQKQKQETLHPVNTNPGVHPIGVIDVDRYRCITQDIATDEVIITDERIEHIKEHHPGHWESIGPFLQAALIDPDYILKYDAKTGLILKTIEENDLQFQLVLRLHTSDDPAGFKNSVLSAWQIRKKEYNRLIRNKIILYKR